MANKYITTIKRFTGLSTDTKPTDQPVGSTYLEWDTQNLYISPDGTNWVLKTPSDTLTASTTININQAAGSDTLFTATDQAIRLDFLGVYVPVDVSGGGASSISVETDAVTPIELITSTQGAKANLTAGAILTYSGPAIVPAADNIQLTIAGEATGTDCTCTVWMSYRAVVDGAYVVIA